MTKYTSLVTSLFTADHYSYWSADSWNELVTLLLRLESLLKWLHVMESNIVIFPWVGMRNAIQKKTISFPESALPLSKGTGNGDNGNADSGRRLKKRQKANSLKSMPITQSEMGYQNIQAKKVYRAVFTWCHGGNLGVSKDIRDFKIQRRGRQREG